MRSLPTMARRDRHYPIGEEGAGHAFPPLTQGADDDVSPPRWRAGTGVSPSAKRAAQHAFPPLTKGADDEVSPDDGAQGQALPHRRRGGGTSISPLYTTGRPRSILPATA